MEVLGRIESNLKEWVENKKPNDARKVCEAICKVVLLNADNEETRMLSEQSKFNVLIDSLNPKNLSIAKNHLKKIQVDLSTIQGLGNIDSHDDYVFLNEGDIKSIDRSLKNLVKNVFDNKEYIDIDEKVPLFIYKYVEKNFSENENWKCDKIISIVYPNREITKVREGKSFNFYTFEDFNKKKVGFVFLGRNISFSKAFDKLFKDFSRDISETISLSFLFPREISKSTRLEIKNRKPNIVEKTKYYERDFPDTSFSHEFIEDYIWDYCLPASLKKSSNFNEDPCFIDQWLYKEGHEERLSLEFLDDLINNNYGESKPIHILIGGGGVGKTTFCEQAVQKIDSQLEKGAKKKAILLSSFNLPDDFNSYDESVDSIQSLYKYLDTHSEGGMSSQNLDLNISSGNILIIIDGLDEIESKLKGKFNFEKFIESVVKLNETYLNCSVIITTRENKSQNFNENKCNVYFFKGFDEELVEKYLHKRYSSKSEYHGKGCEGIVLKNIDELPIDDKEVVTPLIMRLLCEIAESDVDDDSYEVHKTDECKYLYDHIPIDKVVYKLIIRDIDKQKISISCDKYFDFLSEIVFEHNSCASISDFNDILEYYFDARDSISGFQVSPLLRRVGDSFRIKDDLLVSFIRSRFISYKIKNNDTESKVSITKAISQFCYKGGGLVDDITSVLEEKGGGYLKSIINNSLEMLDKDDKDQYYRKCISGALYLAISQPVVKKEDCSGVILDLFSTPNGGRIRYLSIYGDFFPIDFNDFSVSKGFFIDYDNFYKSKIPNDKLVFVDSEFRNIDTTRFKKKFIEESNFDNCTLSEDMKACLDISTSNSNQKRSKVVSDLKRIFRVGYENPSFAWKSDGVYKQQCAMLSYSLSLKKYLKIIENEGFIKKESANDGKGNGFRVHRDSEKIVKDFMSQSITGKRVDRLVDIIVKDY